MHKVNAVGELYQLSRSGVEPLTFGFGGRHSIQLSYRDAAFSLLWKLKYRNRAIIRGARRGGGQPVGESEDDPPTARRRGRS